MTAESAVRISLLRNSAAQMFEDKFVVQNIIDRGRFEALAILKQLPVSLYSRHIS